PVDSPLVGRYKPILEEKKPVDPMSLIRLNRLSPEEEFPSLSWNHTCMAKVLTLQMYKRQYNRATDSGFTFDDIIRPGLEDPGDATGPVSVGCVAGDAQSYIVFCDFFDRVIELYHQGYKMTSTQQSDFNYNNLKGWDELDSQCVVSCEVRAGRCVEGFSFPPHCSRGERRRLLLLAKKALSQLDGEAGGTLYSLQELAGHSQDIPSEAMLRTGVARDWPDARAKWTSQDKSLVVWVNVEDHLQLVCTRTGCNIKEAFKCLCVSLQKLEELYKRMGHPFIWKEHLGYVLSSPAQVGTGLRASIQVRLKHLHQHKQLGNILERLRLQMANTGSAGSGVFEVCNAQTIGFTEVELLQLLVDGVKLLLLMDKTLEQPGGTIKHLTPAQK
ncbi:KCRM kinase, partial [Atractosteus spatula]|nr:KCRM kinase [Atractosteus spatula]